jgi:hypothetical protein
VHVVKAGAAAKWWLVPVIEVYSSGFSSAQRRRVRAILERNRRAILEEWYARFPEAP